MIKWNGFFDLSVIKDEEKLKEFYRDALKLSYNHHVDILRGISREKYSKVSSDEFINNHLTLDTHNVAIDRFVARGYMMENDKYGEVACRSDLFIFIYLKLDDLYKLIEKYNIPKFLR